METVFDNAPVECPACGHKSALTYEEECVFSTPYGPEVKYRQRFLRCGTCTEDIHLNIAFNDEEVTRACRESDRQAMNVMLDQLLKNEVPAVHLEHALRVPFGSVNQWREGNFTRAEITLVRLIYTYPWLLEVVDANFEASDRDGHLLMAAAVIMRKT